jgi:DNA-binding transcriptional ArsR family regulator
MKVSRLLNALLVSRTRQKLIEILFYNPSETYYVRELVRLTGEEINSIRRELAHLDSHHLVCSEKRGNRLYYCANPEGEFFYELLCLAHKTANLGAALIHYKQQNGGLKMVLYSYNFLTLSPQSSPSVDMVIIGKVTLREIEAMVKKEEELIGREINYMVMDRSELKLRQSRRDPFLIEFLLSFPAIIVGNPNHFQRTLNGQNP